jgi:leucyl/phenylalanyl-tRNA--protein transferase
MELTPELMLRAYASGIFPMAEDAGDPVLHWLDPDPRGVMPLDKFHVPRRLKKTVRRFPYEITVDVDFAQVIARCGPFRPGGQRTWLNNAIASACQELHELGFAHSVEAWYGGELVGGLYGVAIGGAFFGESMFSIKEDASKIALVHLAARLTRGKFTLLDSQFVTEHLRQFGAIEVSRAAYRRMLSSALKASADFQCAGPGNSPGAGEEELVEAFLQSSSQIS